MAFTVVGGGNSLYIPTTNDMATGALQIEFTRSVNSFALTRYAQLVPVSKMSGYYLRQDIADNVRVTDIKKFLWPIGTDRPVGSQDSFEFVQYTTARNAFPFYIPQESAEQAAWDVVAQHARAKMQLAMTRRTMEAATALSTAGNWGDNYVADPTVSPISAGAWTASSVNNGYIQKSIQNVMKAVNFSSAGGVNPNELIMVISPAVALIIGQSPEVKDYVKNYGAAKEFLQGNGTFSRWGIPPTLFGLGDVVVDDSVKITSKKGAATLVAASVLGNGAYFVSRPGGLVGLEGAPSWSTLQIFAYQDMLVEQWLDAPNKRTEGRVIDNSVAAITSSLAGYCIGSVV